MPFCLLDYLSLSFHLLAAQRRVYGWRTRRLELTKPVPDLILPNIVLPFREEFTSVALMVLAVVSRHLVHEPRLISGERDRGPMAGHETRGTHDGDNNGSCTMDYKVSHGCHVTLALAK
jgi:hypothetical protein